MSLCRHCCWADRWLVLRDQLLYTDRTLRLACALPLRSRPVPAVGVPYGLQYRPCASPLPAPLAFRLRSLPPSFSSLLPRPLLVFSSVPPSRFQPAQPTEAQRFSLNSTSTSLFPFHLILRPVFLFLSSYVYVLLFFSLLFYHLHYAAPSSA